MNTNELIKILEEIRLLLIDYINKNRILFQSGLCIEKDFKIVEYTDIMASRAKVSNPCDIYGLTMIRVIDWNKTKNGARIAKNRIVDFIAIRNTDALSIEAIIHTFLHELAHTITIPEMNKSTHVKAKIKKIQPMVNNTLKFIPNHHSPTFYANFSRILRIANELDIYKLPTTHRNFTVKSIHRYDTMINPSDNLSLGYSKKYSKT
jgi:hypothetical protein